MTADHEIAVLGGGPAGANAALAATLAGLTVLMIDEAPEAGGQVWRAKSKAVLDAPVTPETSEGDALRTALSSSGVTHFAGTQLWQIERIDGIWHLRLLRDGKVKLVTAHALILAPGAREFVQPVPGWTTPGVLGLAGATVLFKQELALPGARTVVSGTGPLVFFVASEIRRLGGEVAAVVTPNSFGDWLRATPAMMARPDLMRRGALWIADLMLAGVPIKWRHSVTKVTGEDRVRSVAYRKLDADWRPTGASREIEADSVCHGHGLIANIEAAQLAGLPISHHPELGGWVPEAQLDGSTAVEGLYLCGDGAGIRGAAAAEIHGQIAGLSAAIGLGANGLDAKRQTLLARHAKAARFGLAMTVLSIPRPGLSDLTTDDTVLCRCENLSRAKVAAEIESGAGSTNAVKSGLRAGMGPCGGKYCQTAVARLIEAAENLPAGSVPPPTPRPPLRPVPVGAMAGDFSYDDLPIPRPAPL